MSSRAIQLLKCFVFLLCLVPLARLVWYFVQQDLGADPVLEITHVTGHWALWMLLISLAVTPVRRLHPKLAWLIRFRRMLGLFAFFYATLHLATYVFLFSGFDIVGAWSSIRAHDWVSLHAAWSAAWSTMWGDIQRRPFIQVGLFAWFLLLLLALTSPAWVMRKMGGKPWQRLHYLVYLAGYAAITHYWWLVKAGVKTPMKVTILFFALLLARLVWWMMKRRRTMKAQTA